MKITGITTHAVGNRWKNWLFVRVDTDEGIHGLGEGSLNGFCRTVEAAVHELEPMVIGRDPFATESLVLHLARDLYSEGGQIHGASDRGDRDRLLGHQGQSARSADLRTARWARARADPGLRQRLVPGRAVTRRLRPRRGRCGRGGLPGAQVRPVRRGLAHADPARSGRVDRYRRRGAGRGRLRCRPDDRRAQSILALHRDRDLDTTGRLPPGVVRRAGPPPERCRHGARRALFRCADRHR